MADEQIAWIAVVTPEQAEASQDGPLLEAYKEVMAQNPHGKADNVMQVPLFGSLFSPLCSAPAAH